MHMVHAWDTSRLGKLLSFTISSKCFQGQLDIKILLENPRKKRWKNHRRHHRGDFTETNFEGTHQLVPTPVPPRHHPSADW